MDFKYVDIKKKILKVCLPWRKFPSEMHFELFLRSDHSYFGVITTKVSEILLVESSHFDSTSLHIRREGSEQHE